MRGIVIIGAGGFAREVKMLIEQINQLSNIAKWQILGFYDDAKTKGELINGAPVLGGIDDINNDFSDTVYGVVAVGDPKTKKKITQRITNKNLRWANIIHPNVQVEENQYLKIGVGNIICNGVIITTNVKIGNHVIINLDCTVGHDAVIGDYCSFMPSVNISGETHFCDGVYCGTGSIIVNQKTIEEFAIIGAGAVVSKNIPANCTAVGIPARPIKFHEK